MNKPPIYRDTEGNILYGFSQVSLDTLNERISILVIWLKRMFILVLIGLILAGMLLGYLGWEVWHDNVLNNIIAACVGK